MENKFISNYRIIFTAETSTNSNTEISCGNYVIQIALDEHVPMQAGKNNGFTQKAEEFINNKTQEGFERNRINNFL